MGIYTLKKHKLKKTHEICPKIRRLRLKGYRKIYRYAKVTGRI